MAHGAGDAGAHRRRSAFAPGPRWIESIGSIADGNRHDGDLPLLLAGRGGGVLSGRHLRFPPETPCANLFVSLLALAGVPRAAFGDSTGVLEGLLG